MAADAIEIDIVVDSADAQRSVEQFGRSVTTSSASVESAAQKQQQAFNRVRGAVGNLAQGVSALNPALGGLVSSIASTTSALGAAGVAVAAVTAVYAAWKTAAEAAARHQDFLRERVDSLTGSLDDYISRQREANALASEQARLSRGEFSGFTRDQLTAHAERLRDQARLTASRARGEENENMRGLLSERAARFEREATAAEQAASTAGGAVTIEESSITLVPRGVNRRRYQELVDAGWSPQEAAQMARRGGGARRDNREYDTGPTNRASHYGEEMIDVSQYDAQGRRIIPKMGGTEFDVGEEAARIRELGNEYRSVLEDIGKGGDKARESLERMNEQLAEAGAIGREAGALILEALSTSPEKALKNWLKSFAEKQFLLALEQTAMGVGALFINPAEASTHFESAALHGAAAAAAGVAGKALSGGGGRGGRGGSEPQRERGSGGGKPQTVVINYNHPVPLEQQGRMMDRARRESDRRFGGAR